MFGFCKTPYFPHKRKDSKMPLKQNENNFRLTRFACYLCFIIQAIIINFPPVLFLIFSDQYGVPLARITLLVIINFSMQFVMDSLSAIFASKLNYRAVIITANIFSALGLISLGILPELFADAYVGLFIATLISAVGSGLIEVMGNPIMQSCPKKGRSFSMGFLHSFYCWGHLGVVLISTVFLLILGSENWKLISFVWAAVPTFNAILFVFAPIDQPSQELEKTSSLSSLAKTKMFWLFIFIMILAGACEQGIAQWASAFAELALEGAALSPSTAKIFGDLLGPCFFALTMAVARMIYPRVCEKFDLRKTMILSSALCAVCYAVAAISENAFISLIGCGLCGFSVGIMWPGTLDLAGKTCTFVGTAFFAMLSLAGDIGCTTGPALVGLVADAFGGELKIGLLTGAILPVALVVILLLFNEKKQNSNLNKH